MRGRKWLWIGFAILCLLALGVGSLARGNSVDELQALLARQPDDWTIYRDDHGNYHWLIRFKHLTAPQVLEAVGIERMPIHDNGSYRDACLWMPSGRMLSVIEYPGNWTDVQLYAPASQSWFERAWLSSASIAAFPNENRGATFARIRSALRQSNCDEPG